MMKTNNTYFFYKPRRSIGFLLAASLILAQPVYSNAETESSFQDQVLTRVDETTDGGLIRSHLEDSDGNIYTDNTTGTESSSETSSLSDPDNIISRKSPLTGKSVSLPAAYDLRDYGLTTSIKDQGLTGCCWAFSAVKAIESNCIKLGLISADAADFSENHLTWFSYSPSTDTNDPLYGDGIAVTSPGNTAYFPDSLLGSTVANTYPYDNGGSATLATFTLAKWSGLEWESNAPFSAATAAALNAMAANMAQNAALRYNSRAHMQNAISFDEYSLGENYYYKNSSMIAEMKQAIIENGAMSVAFYYDRNYVNTNSHGTSYYQTAFSGSKAVKSANHCVTIVGWDDNYSRSNFSSQPSGNGAWLIANSYGSDYGDNGYFWLSYYDQSICDCYIFQTESADNYDSIYQYDGFGWSNANYSSSNNIKAANIFTADNSKPQLLRAVSFYTLTDDQEYKIQIYRGVSSKPEDGVLISESTTTGVLEHNGYYTIPLASPVSVAAGEKFSVVVTYIRSGSSTVYVPFEGKNSTSSSYSLQYASKPGQSFLYTTMTTDGKQSWYDTSNLGYNNVCIKAFADDTDAASPLPVAKKKVTLGKGETYKLASSSRTFQSADTSIATVSSKGKVTAKATGKTTITISNGTSTTLLTVTVKKAPSSIRLKPSGKKNMKCGKSFQLTTKLSAGSASHKLTYSTSRKKVATVSSSGKVKAKRKGTAVIKVKTYNGKTAKIKVIVKKK
ncbi:MAG: Ig-like domain-containing protein [Lachnospiraceae bacterium]|nr:Ig-like domain-containing protein [Lachnospiraceae bacterium]